MIDPATIARAIAEVREALERAQLEAKDAFTTASDEHRSTSIRVADSTSAAIRALAGADELDGELTELESSLRSLHGEVARAASLVETRARTHQQLTDHVIHTRAAWREHLARAEQDHAAAASHLRDARSVEAAASDRLGFAHARLRRARSDEERSAAQSDLARAEADHNAALAECRQAMGWEQEQRARVERCARALHLAEQAVDAMEVAASHVKQASASTGDGPAALGRVEASVRRARAHLETMEQAADEALRHANRARDHLTTATQALREAEDWHQRGQVLAMDTTHDLSEQIRQLQQIDAPIGGGGPATPSARATRQSSALGGADDVFAQLNTVLSTTGATVAARLDLGGVRAVGTNLSRDSPPIKGTFSFFVQHAEGAAVSQLIDAGDHRGKSASLYVTRRPCNFCVASISAAARSMGLAKLVVTTPDGIFATYTPETGLIQRK